MEKSSIPFIALSFCLLLTSSHGWIQKGKRMVGDHKSVLSNERKVYIVYMGNGHESGIPRVDEHHRILSSVIGDEKLAMEHRIHSYGRSINAFAARLLTHEAEQLKSMEGVISVFPNTLRKLHTTRSWDFVGLPMSVKRSNAIESNLIVGMIDTGIFMDNPFFDDKGFGPPPAKWKGSCDKGISGNFSGCNNKVIGARYYYDRDVSDGEDDDMSPTDTEGHGTHTSSTVAGGAVSGANFYDLATGTGRGGVPSARIAMYKVCWIDGCTDLSILMAFDDAIADGVDVISFSIGGSPTDYFVDSIAIGSFHAMQKGILTVASGGNDGPFMSTVANVPPWMFTIAASGLDRMFITDLKLGNGKQFAGRETLNTFTPEKKSYPLIDGYGAKNHPGNGQNARSCSSGLDESKVKGKIVLCEDTYGSDSDKVLENKGIGFISLMYGTDGDFPSSLPTTLLKAEDCNSVEQYINSTKNPTAVIEKTRIAKRPAPFVADFSSRGPNYVSDFILKPDVTAPGVDILAGWSTLNPLTESPEDTRYVKFNIVSGTSMSCPHVSAASLYVKSFHPDWSPAAIKSALMTTTTPIKLGVKVGPLAYGSGQINPTGAVHPGLVYDLDQNDYIAFLCKEGYTSLLLSTLVGDKVDCPKPPSSKAQQSVVTDGINYPSMSYTVRENTTNSVRAVFERTVTNVGYGKSVYKASVVADKGLSVSVVPDTLTFNERHEKKSFKVMVRVDDLSEAEVFKGVLEWSDSRHKVSSPIAIVNYAIMHY